MQLIGKNTQEEKATREGWPRSAQATVTVLVILLVLVVGIGIEKFGELQARYDTLNAQAGAVTTGLELSNKINESLIRGCK